MAPTLDLILKSEANMSNGYLIISDKNLDVLQKDRYMKFEKVAVPGNWYGYARMTYLDGPYQLVDENSRDSSTCTMSEYGNCFFANLKARHIYFVYFLLTKTVTLENVISNAFKAINIKTNIKIPALFLHDIERQAIEENKTYRISDKPPDNRDRQWRQ